MTIAVISILAISALVWVFNKISPFTVCPICAGAFLTWVGLLGAYNFGYQIDLAVPALLMGGSVVGIAYQLEKKFAEPSLLWKVFFIPAGFVAAYGILEQLWTVFFLAIVFLFLLSFAFLSANITGNPRMESENDLENKMKDCC